MRPEDYQPTLTWWGHLWRAVLVLAIAAVAATDRANHQWHDARWWLALDLALGAASFVAMWWRREHPVATATATSLATLFSATAAGPSTLVLVSLATRRQWSEIAPQAVLALACAIGSEFIFRLSTDSESVLLILTVTAAALAATFGWGMYIGSRRELVASWRSRAILAEAEQDAEVRRAQSEERARIAREMHDVLAHRISTVSMYAGVLAYRDDLTRTEVTETAKTIEDTSRLALTELREVLGVLREGPGDAAPEQPYTSAIDVDELIAESVADGMRIDYTRTADVSTLATSRRRTLYRCLQEALTNARKHAPSVAVSVEITGDAGRGVDLRVTNPLPLRPMSVTPPQSGFGLVGVAERVALSGGRQSTMTTDDQRFVLHVWLPWQS